MTNMERECNLNLNICCLDCNECGVVQNDIGVSHDLECKANGRFCGFGNGYSPNDEHCKGCKYEEED